MMFLCAFAMLPPLQDYLRRLEVWWADDEAWYAGRVTGYNASRQRHTIKYDDGEVERVFLPGERYRWGGKDWGATWSWLEREGAQLDL